MNKLNELIEKLCPNGVKFEILGNRELFKFYYGKGNKIPEDVGGIYDVYGANGVVSHINEYNCEDVSIIGHIGTVGMVNRCKEKCFVTYNGTIAEVVDKNKVNTQYLYYVLTTLNLPAYKKGNQPFLSVSDFDKIRIPVPPMKVQNEIVLLLDNYTKKFEELSKELSKEIIYRKKEFEYYREKILDSGKNIEWVPLLSVSDTYTGLTYKPAQVCDKGTLVLRSSNIRDNRIVLDDNVYVQMENIPERAIVKKDDILICVRNGSKALIGKAAVISEHNEKMAFGAFMTILRANKKIHPKYLFFVWQSPRIQNMIHSDSGMPINQITKKMLESINIPLISKKEQEKIIDILENLDNLSTEIIKLIASELENLKKQYEYYRDKLLTFKELKVEN